MSIQHMWVVYNASYVSDCEHTVHYAL